MSEKPGCPDFEKALQAFTNYLRFEKNVSAHTLAAYQRDLAHLQQFARRQQLSLSELHQSHIRQCLAERHRQGIRPRSLQRWLSALRTFCEYSLKRGWIQANPCRGIQAPRVSRPLPKTLDTDQVARLMQIEGAGFIACRDRACLELFYSCGLRLGELVALDWTHLDLQQGQVRVTGKGRKIRELPVGRMAIEALEDWRRAQRQQGGADSAAVFTSQRGQRLQPRSIQE